mmetsp:Transcript_7382/g.13442  ORF Transcript_7382/g.13442 Transcript_7382/m.13442 type:complete len:84 (-) Transcript_7382:158-409(-)
MTFADRRAVLKRRTRAVKVMMNQTSMQSIGRLDTLDRLETEATMYDEFATEAGRETVADRVTLPVPAWHTSYRTVVTETMEGK